MIELLPECVFKSTAHLGEAPLWSEKNQLLYWTDIHGKLIHAFDPIAKCETNYSMPDLVTAVALQNGGLLLALSKQIACLDLQTGQIKVLHEAEKNVSGIRFNDGKCDCKGRFWVGTINTIKPTDSNCTLYSYDGEQLRPMLRDIVFSNGLAWSPDSHVFFHVETFKKAIFAYDFDAETGSLTGKRLFVSLEENGGLPDGITVDEEGGVWCAHYGKGQVVRYDKKGKVSDVIRLPVPNVTNCAFGGKDFDMLYITTAQENLSSVQLKKYPHSGSLFAIRVSYKGVPETPFLGNL